MIYSLLADGILILHLAFILFVVFGALLVLYRRWILLLHLPAAAWGAWIEFSGWICPLTPLEQRLRLLADESAYSSGFVEHYLLPLIYPAGLTSKHQFVLGIAVVLFNMLLYALVLLKQKHQNPSRAGRRQ